MLLSAIADAVDNAIIGGELHDPVLAILLDLLLEEKQSGRHVFPDIMTEPVLYRHMRQIVSQSVSALQETEQATKKALSLEGLWTSINSFRT